MFGHVSSGAENDLREATTLAFRMVAHYGMSRAIGPVYHEQRTEHPFLGQRLATEGSASDATMHAIEDETRRVLVEAQRAARRLLEEHRPELQRLVAALLQRETLEKNEIARVLAASGAGAGAAASSEERHSVS
jgi:cell division protease FtsH